MQSLILKLQAQLLACAHELSVCDIVHAELRKTGTDIACSLALR